MSKWKVIMENEKIPSICEELKENQPLSIQFKQNRIISTKSEFDAWNRIKL